MSKSRVRQKREAHQTAGSSVFWCGFLGVALALLLALHLWSASSQQLHITAPLREDGSKLSEEPLTSVASDAETDSAALAADFFDQVRKLSEQMENKQITVDYPHIGKTAVLEQRWQIGDDRSTGGIVWTAAIELSQWLSSAEQVAGGAMHLGMHNWSWHNKTSLELGCGGAALPSIIAAWQGAAATASDGDSATLKLARRNLDANTADARHLPRTTQLRWGAPDADTVYDVVLASDLTYMEDLAPLLRALAMHTAPNGIVLLSYEQRNLQAENLLVIALKRKFQVHKIAPRATPGTDAANIVILMMRPKMHRHFAVDHDDETEQS